MLNPHVRKQLEQVQPTLLVESYAGGGIVFLTVVREGLVKRCVMIELDSDVAAFGPAQVPFGAGAYEKCPSRYPDGTRDHGGTLAHLNPVWKQG